MAPFQLPCFRKERSKHRNQSVPFSLPNPDFPTKIPMWAVVEWRLSSSNIRYANLDSVDLEGLQIITQAMDAAWCTMGIAYTIRPQPVRGTKKYILQTRAPWKIVFSASASVS